MSGSDEVGVDAGRVSQAAGALANLRDVLAANVPTIVNLMNEYWSSGAGSPVSLAALHQAQSRSVDDATQMQTRAQLAEAWLAQGVSLTGSGMVNIPFSGPALDDADATIEAQALAAAEAQAGKNPSAARAKIAAIEQEIAEHVGDGKAGTPWLQDFYNDAAPAVASLASTLHGLENSSDAPPDYLDRFTVLTEDDQKILATFGQGLAAADAAGLSPEAVQAIANAPDAWSAAMLVKFGPPGSLWATSEPKSKQNPDGLSLLALLTDYVYSQEQDGTLRIPIGNGSNYSAYDRDQLANVLAGYDPLQVMMQADAQNKDAAWQVMGGQDGSALAKMLLNSVNGDLPGIDGRFVQGPLNGEDRYAPYFTLYPPGKSVDNSWGQILINSPDQNVVGAFLDAATSAPRGNGPQAWYSAQAALNIILKTPSPIGNNGITEDPAVQQALLHTAQRYLLDLAESTTFTYPSAVIPYGGDPHQLYVLKILGDADGATPLSTFLQQIMANGTDAKILTGTTTTAMSQYYALFAQGKIPTDVSDPDVSMASLYARLMVEAGNIRLNTATLTDQQAEQVDSTIDFAKDAVTWLPVVGGYAEKAESLAGLFGISTDLPADHAVTAQQNSERDFAVSETTVDVPMVQALISAGAVPASDLTNTSSWLVNGKITLTSPTAAADFSSWEDAHPGTMDQLYQRESQYQTAMNLQEGIAENKAGSGG
jgi:hypothetical protein